MIKGAMKFIIGLFPVFWLSDCYASMAKDKSLLKDTVQKPALTLSYALPVDCTAASPATEDCVMEEKTDSKDTETPKRKLFYTIGGVRLKFDFDVDSLTAAEKKANPKYEWTFGRKGRECLYLNRKKEMKTAQILRRIKKSKTKPQSGGNLKIGLHRRKLKHNLRSPLIIQR